MIDYEAKARIEARLAAEAAEKARQDERRREQEQARIKMVKRRKEQGAAEQAARWPDLPVLAPELQSLVHFVNDETATTSSLLVAEKFGVLHKNVLQKIQNLGCSNQFTELNFQLSEYIDPTGRPLPCYEMTKNGFMFLAMRFTTPSATEWQEKFVEAFDWMAKKLAAIAARNSTTELNEMRRQRDHEWYQAANLRGLSEKLIEREEALQEKRDVIKEINGIKEQLAESQATFNTLSKQIDVVHENFDKLRSQVNTSFPSVKRPAWWQDVLASLRQLGTDGTNRPLPGLRLKHLK